MSQMPQVSCREKLLIVGVIVYEDDRTTPYDLRTIIYIDGKPAFEAPTDSDLINFIRSHKGKKIELYYS